MSGIMSVRRGDPNERRLPVCCGGCLYDGAGILVQSCGLCSEENRRNGWGLAERPPALEPERTTSGVEGRVR
jgi:hypothetical protein